MPGYPSTSSCSPTAVVSHLSRMAVAVTVAALTAPVAAQQDPYTDVFVNVICASDAGVAVEVFVGGLWSNRCVPRVTSVTLIDSEIRVRLDTRGGICLSMVTEWSDIARIEDVPPGTYAVVVDIYRFFDFLYESTTHGPISTYCCPADLAEPFGVLNFFDIALFLSLFQTQDSAADWNGDGVFNFFDIASYLNAFNGGCP